MDFMGPMNPPSEGCTWILGVIKLFTKWVEAVAMKKATDSLVANFLRKNIIWGFGVPSKIISKNGTPFLNKDVCHLIEWYSISHMTSISYYPKGNGQAEPSNKRLLKIFGKMTKLCSFGYIYLTMVFENLNWQFLDPLNNWLNLGN